MPLSRSDHWEHYSRLGPFASLRFKALYLVRLVKALAYLPLASWRSLVCAVPLVSLNLSVAYYPQFRCTHYDDFASVFLVVAAMHGAVVVLRAVGSAFKGWRAIATYIFLVLVALLLTEPTASAIFSLQGSWFSYDERQVQRKPAVYRRLVTSCYRSQPHAARFQTSNGFLMRNVSSTESSLPIAAFPSRSVSPPNQSLAPTCPRGLDMSRFSPHPKGSTRGVSSPGTRSL